MSQALLKDNVVSMQRSVRDNRNVGEDIMKFLRRHDVGRAGEKSTTSAEYERDIRRFFKLMWGKELNQLSVQDLDILPMHVEEYQTYLSNFGYKGSTVNRNIASVRALYGFFQENRYRYWAVNEKEGEWIYILSSIFNAVDPLSTNDSESYGMLYDHEVKEMIERAKKLENGFRKSLAIELASVTSFRLEAIVKLTLKDFRKENNTWVAKTIDKNKVHEKSIRTDLYEKLVYFNSGDKIFNFSVRTLQRTLETLIEEMEIDEDRNITFHSLKKYGVGEVHMLTNGNIKAIIDQGNWASFETANKHYLTMEKDYSRMPSLMIGQSIDLSPLTSMSKEELLDIIMKTTRATQFEMLDIINNRPM